MNELVNEFATFIADMTALIEDETLRRQVAFESAAVLEASHDDFNKEAFFTACRVEL